MKGRAPLTGYERELFGPAWADVDRNGCDTRNDILRRDLANMREKYDVDPNLLRIASYYSVMTRLLPPMRKKFPSSWSQRKIELYLNITPEQKLFIYSAYSE